MNFLNDVFFIIGKKLKIKLIILFVLSLLGTIIEILTLVSIFPLLIIILGGKSNFIEYFDSIKILQSFHTEGLLNLAEQQDITFYIILIIFLFFLIKTIYFIFLLKLQTSFCYDSESYISKKLFKFYIFNNYEFFLKNKPSELFRNIYEEVRNFRKLCLNSILNLLVEIFIFTGILILIILVNSKLIVLILFIIFIIVLLVFKFTKDFFINNSSARIYYDGLRIKHINQAILGIREIKIFGKENIFINYFKKFTNLSNEKWIAHNFWTSASKYFAEFLLIIIILFIFSYLDKYEANNLQYYLPSLAFTVTASIRLLPSITKIINSFNLIRSSYPSMKIILDEMLKTKNNPIITTQYEKDLKNFNQFNNLKLENINYKYNEENNYILKNITVEINKGDKIGIFGKSGQGKSTLINIIAGLIKPSLGKIFLNNIEVYLSTKEWYKFVAYLSQNIFILDSTLIENITLEESKEKINYDQFKEAKKIAEIDDYLFKILDNKKKQFGETGSFLSGGQKQKIGIARAIYSNKEILIFDEPTNGIDEKTEQKIYKNFSQLDKTLIIISHNRNLLNYCNKIIKFDEKNGVEIIKNGF